MARTILDRELQDLDTQILRMGTLVDEALGKALDALAKGDLAETSIVIEADVIIDALRTTIEEHAVRLLAMQQPLGGRDLRYLTSALSIASDLERIGDGAEGIAQILLRMLPLRSTNPQEDAQIVARTADGNPQLTEAAVIRELLDLGKEARRVLQGTMKAFGGRDAKAARYLWEEDDVVDVRYHQVRHNLMAMMTGAHAIPTLQNDSRALQRVTYLLWIAHKLERAADHSQNICERIVFTIEGEADFHAAESADKV